MFSVKNKTPFLVALVFLAFADAACATGEPGSNSEDIAQPLRGIPSAFHSVSIRNATEGPAQINQVKCKITPAGSPIGQEFNFLDNPLELNPGEILNLYSQQIPQNVLDRFEQESIGRVRVKVFAKWPDNSERAGETDWVVLSNSHSQCALQNSNPVNSLFHALSPYVLSLEGVEPGPLGYGSSFI